MIDDDDDDYDDDNEDDDDDDDDDGGGGGGCGGGGGDRFCVRVGSTTLLLPPLEKRETNEVGLTLGWCSWKRMAHTHTWSFGCGHEVL